jgi:5'(3')-deoxyribonucleotidase
MNSIKMRISLDVDEVLRPCVKRAMEVYNEMYGDNVKYETITSWKLEPYFKKCPDVALLFKNCARRIFLEAEPYPYVKEILTVLNKNHEIWIITHQYNGVEQYTLQWLHQHKLPYHSIVFTPHKFVVKTDILVDDAIHNLEDFPGRAICMDRPWNQDWKGERIFNLKELLTLL